MDKDCWHWQRCLLQDMSLVMRKPAFCICENKDADQLRGNREADQRLCFRYTDSTIPLLPKSEISSLSPSSVTVQPGLCRTRSETPKTGFLTTRLILILYLLVCYKHAVCFNISNNPINIFSDRQVIYKQSNLGLLQIMRHLQQNYWVLQI